MAYIPQPWPPEAVEGGKFITQQNDTFVLTLFLSFVQLHKKDNPGYLQALLPSLEECIKIVYREALEIAPLMMDVPANEWPMWARQINTIINDYPGILIELKSIEKSLNDRRLIDTRKMLVKVFNKTAKVQTKLIRIPLAARKKNTPRSGGYILQLNNLTQITEEIAQSNHNL